MSLSNYSYEPNSKKLTVTGVSMLNISQIEAACKGQAVDVLQTDNCALTSDSASFPVNKISSIIQPHTVFLPNNSFDEMPDFSSFERLTTLSLKFCGIKKRPKNILPHTIEWLILTGNRMQYIPASIGKLTKLRKVALAGNEFVSIPEEMQECENIELLRLSANKLDIIPDWVMKIPKLAWYGYGGNNFNQTNMPTNSPIQAINRADIVLDKKLNESPSSYVYSGHINNSGVSDGEQIQQSVAVKIFKGDLTSDGFPKDDMHASIHAGNHDNLIQIQGYITEHPEGKQGLVLGLIPDTYDKLGLPPNAKTVTRDSFPSGTNFSAKGIQNIALDTAEALAHMHKRGIMHGDIYAHNTLTKKDGHSIVGDFGAATMYTPQYRSVQERVDMLGYAHLLEDILLLCDDKDTDEYNKLISIHEECSKPLEDRPVFNDVLGMLT